MTRNPWVITISHPQFCWDSCQRAAWSGTSQSNYIIDSERKPREKWDVCPSVSSVTLHFSRAIQASPPGELVPLKRELTIPEFLIPADDDLKDFLLDFEEDLRALHPVRCSPSPGEKGGSSSLRSTHL